MINKLAQLLNVPNTEYMQDWGWEISDSKRLNEYIILYNKAHMTDDDKFTIMETILQAVDDILDEKSIAPRAWSRIRHYLIQNFKLHEYTIHYWSNNEICGLRCENFRVSRFMRVIKEQANQI